MKKYFVAVIASAAALAVQAEGFYVGIGAGFIKSKGSAADINDTLVSNLGGTASTSMKKRINNLRLMGGYKINENLAVEVGYIKADYDLIKYSGTTSGNVAYSGVYSGNFSGFDVSGIIRPSVSTGFNNAFGIIGIHNYKGRGSNAVTNGVNTGIEGGNTSGTGVLFGLGYDWRIAKDLDMRLSVTRINKFAGESGSNVTMTGLGLIKHF